MVIEHGNMGIVIGAPHLHPVELAASYPRPCINIPGHLPVGDTIDTIWIGVICVGTLQSVPHKIFKVILHRFNLLLVRKPDILCSHVGSLAQSRVITGKHISPPVVKSIGIIRAS